MEQKIARVLLWSLVIYNNPFHPFAILSSGRNAWEWTLLDIICVDTYVVTLLTCQVWLIDYSRRNFLHYHAAMIHPQQQQQPDNDGDDDADDPAAAASPRDPDAAGPEPRPPHRKIEKQISNSRMEPPRLSKRFKKISIWASGIFLFVSVTMQIIFVDAYRRNPGMYEETMISDIALIAAISLNAAYLVYMIVIVSRSAVMLSDRWLPRLLTPGDNTDRMLISMYRRQGRILLALFVTITGLCAAALFTSRVRHTSVDLDKSVYIFSYGCLNVQAIFIAYLFMPSAHIRIGGGSVPMVRLDV